MRVYIGFDDTDHAHADRGTGKLVRWFEDALPPECRLWGVVRQQLLVHDDIPYTSHNSSACAVVEVPNAVDVLDDLIRRATEHIERYSLEGSDPGLCVVCEDNSSLPRVLAFGRECTQRVVTQKDAMAALAAGHLSGHGGSNDGIIGAAAAVGLTAHGWSGRFIEFGRLRQVPDRVSVSHLAALNILPVSLDRNCQVPAPEDLVLTNDWLRPRLWGQRPILPVTPKQSGVWEALGGKRRANGNGKGNGNGQRTNSGF